MLSKYQYIYGYGHRYQYTLTVLVACIGIVISPLACISISIDLQTCSGIGKTQNTLYQYWYVLQIRCLGPLLTVAILTRVPSIRNCTVRGSC